MFNIFKKEETEKENNHPSITAVACLLIHSARIDENYTNKEKKIIKDAIIEVKGEYAYGLLKSEIYIDEILYHYLFNPDHTETQKVTQ